ncbi:hypothetical protein AM500_03255 [Bacillus sp. FJAT-18017]|uniref:TniQ family protein n=1 Tax=Bacillus sp. FJAT-18017 TaxID=1705566 RepID=UPI0006AE0228|nr:TniQ family protein [Bacillus sp. FJAT-18017]ALC88926.1 hypothetical protein AM500_03255 [Bacillus sp. FJAT-18017]
MEYKNLQQFENIIIDDFGLEIYPIYNIPPVIKPSIVYGKDRESLTSFILRLTHAHCLTIGKFTGQLLTPNLSEKYSKNPYRFPPPRINGCNKLSIITVDTIQRLSNLSDDLSLLTFKFFDSVVSNKNLTKNYRAWCPSCLQEMKISGKTIYEKLIWSINNYEVCVTHNALLSISCNFCGMMQEILPDNGQNGHCQYCNSWLGSEKVTDLENDSKTIREEICYKSRQVETILNYFYNKPVKKDKLLSSLKKISEEYEFQMKELCLHILGIPYTTFNNYCKSGGKFSLDNILEISWRLKIDILNLMENNNIEYRINKNGFVPRKKRYNHQKDSKRVEQYLKNVILSPEYIPVVTLENTLHITLTTLRKRFPKEYKKIQAKNNAIRKKYGKKLVEKAAYEANHVEIERYLKEVLKSKDLIPINHISSKLGVSSTFLKKKFPQLVLNIMNKNTEIMKLRPKGYSFSKSYKKFGQKQLNEVKERLLFILCSITDEPKYIKEILEGLGKSQRFVNCFPEIFESINEANILALNRKRQKVFQEQCEIVKKTVCFLNDQGVYPGLKQIEKYTNFKMKKELNDYRSTLFNELGIQKKDFGH